MEIVVDLTRHRIADSRRLLEIVESGSFDGPSSAKVHEERALPVGPNSRDLIQRRGGQALSPLRAVRSDCKPVSFVAQTLEIEEQSRVRLKGDFAAAGKMEDLAALAAV